MKEKDSLFVFLVVIATILTVVTLVVDVRTLWFWYQATNGIITWETFGKAFTLSLWANAILFPFRGWMKIMEEK